MGEKRTNRKIEQHPENRKEIQENLRKYMPSSMEYKKTLPLGSIETVLVKMKTQ